ncbi:MAG: hypothetical protein Q9163_001411 [Psora crenata]
MATSRSPTPPSTKRLLQELKTNRIETPGCLLSLGPVSEENNLLHWEAVMEGVPGTAYETGRWKLYIQIPAQYPLAPPTVTFLTPCCHPNVHFKTGEICLDLLKGSWTPTYTIASTLEAVHQLLADPEVDSPLNVDVAALIKQGDRVGADGLVRFWCEEMRWEG